MSYLNVYLVVYGVIALGHLAVQMVFGHLEHLRQKRKTYAGVLPSVTVVVPAYNEDPALLHRCLLSIDRQDYPEMEVIVVDDGSQNVEAVLPVHDDFSSGRFRVLLRPDNTGKRNCQAVVFEQARSEVVITIDSDTVLLPNAIRTLVRRFEDPKVGAVTGNVEVINKRQNLLTRLIAYRYWTAFNQERAAQSFFGVVMCASGPFSAYRRTIIDEVRESYISQTFLGRACTFGDDRHLTNLVLGLGHKVVYDEAAVAVTQVPSHLSGYVRQQVRWNKSFYREILWTAKFAHQRNPYMGMDLFLQTIMPFALVFALGATVYAAVVDPTAIVRYLGVVATIGLARAAYGVARTKQLGFLLFVCYGFIHVFVLMPVRLFALATMRQGHWGTRGDDGEEADVAATRRKLVHLRSAAGRSEAEKAWARDIRETVEGGSSFLLHWQPVRDAASGEVNHGEVLLRLRHDGQTLAPAGFLSIAEEHGLMPKVDRRVVREAVALLAAAPEDEPLRLEVNVSADSMRDPQFTALLEEHLRTSGAQPRNLVLAVPERVALDEPDAAAAFGRRVRSLGCLFALDNFDGEIPEDSWRRLLGTLPLDYVKIGGDLVLRLPDSAHARARLARLVAITRSLGVETIAVFVGDAETARLLQEARVGMAQGFFIGAPAPVERSLQDIAEAASAQQVAIAV